jgi:peptidoglycan pentaglycine glycine transferase (the first glycine)
MAVPPYECLGPDRRAAFDAFVAGAERPDFLQLWAWGELKETTGWRAHRLLVPGPRGEPWAACLVLERRLPGVGSLLYAPRGPIVDWADRHRAETALRALVAFAGAHRAVALKVDPAVPKDDPVCGPLLAALGFRRADAGLAFEGVQPRFVMHLPLGGRDEASLLAGMHPKTRYNIRLAERKGVRVRLGGEDDVPAFYRLLQETAARDGFLVRDQAYFEALWRYLLAPGHGWLLLGEAGGELLAAAVVFRVGRTAWYLYGATSSRRRELMPMYAVQWQAIRRALADGCTLYDFRGVAGDLRPEHPLYGLYRFKRGFGATLVEYVGEWDLPLRPWRFLVLQRGLPVARRAAAWVRGRGRGRSASLVE